MSKPLTETEIHTDAPIRFLTPEQTKTRDEMNAKNTTESIRKKILELKSQ